MYFVATVTLKPESGQQAMRTQRTPYDRHGPYPRLTCNCAVTLRPIHIAAPNMNGTEETSSVYHLDPGRCANHHDERICLSVCLSVCALAYLQNHLSKFHRTFCADCPAVVVARSSSGCKTIMLSASGSKDESCLHITIGVKLDKKVERL